MLKPPGWTPTKAPNFVIFWNFEGVLFSFFFPQLFNLLLQKLQSYIEIDSALLVNFETPRNLNLGESPKVPPLRGLGMKYGSSLIKSIRPLSVTNCPNGMSNFSACSHWLFRSAFDQCNFHLGRIWSLHEPASPTLAPW
jgi:hypothetical protein